MRRDRTRAYLVDSGKMTEQSVADLTDIAADDAAITIALPSIRARVDRALLAGDRATLESIAASLIDIDDRE